MLQGSDIVDICSDMFSHYVDIRLVGRVSFKIMLLVFRLQDLFSRCVGTVCQMFPNCVP